MNKEEILNKIKGILNFSTDVVENFLDAKLEDGTTIVRVEGEELAVGLPLLVVTEEGTIPAPEGEHILEDGTKVIVDAEGVITALEAPEATETPEVEVEVELGAESEGEALEMAEEASEEATEDMEDKEPEVDKMGAMEEKLKAIEMQVADLQEVVKEMVAANEEMANFSKITLKKVNDFIESAPADLNFKAIEEIKGSTDLKFSESKKKAIDSLESIKNIRKK